jgi:hypothetical protein
MLSMVYSYGMQERDTKSQTRAARTASKLINQAARERRHADYLISRGWILTAPPMITVEVDGEEYQTARHYFPTGK